MACHLLIYANHLVLLIKTKSTKFSDSIAQNLFLFMIFFLNYIMFCLDPNGACLYTDIHRDIPACSHSLNIKTEITETFELLQIIF